MATVGVMMPLRKERFPTMVSARGDSLLVSLTLLFLGSGKSGCNVACSAMMSLHVKLRFVKTCNGYYLSSCGNFVGFWLF